MASVSKKNLFVLISNLVLIIILSEVCLYLPVPLSCVLAYFSKLPKMPNTDGLSTLILVEHIDLYLPAKKASVS